MRLTFTYKSLTDGSNLKHFLLDTAKLTVKAFLINGQAVDVPVQKAPKGTMPAFTADLTPALLPYKMTRLDIIFKIERSFDGKDFKLLDISQLLLPTVAKAEDVGAANYTLKPGGWWDSVPHLRVSNFATHPLLNLSDLGKGKVELNPAMLDLTDAWMHLHRANVWYDLYRLRSAGLGLNFRIFAYLGGVPLIWYAIVSDHLRGARTISPHVYLSPQDNAIEQPIDDDMRYLSQDASGFSKDDGLKLFQYIVAPVSDVQVKNFPQLPDIDKFRNVVHVDFAGQGANKKRITPLQWKIPAGLQQAFMSTGGGLPAQILLLPQRKRWAGWVASAHLKPATDAVIDLIQSNTTLFQGGGDVEVAKGKMVLSCYSESGHDIWLAAKANIDSIRALVCMEPQNLNSPENQYKDEPLVAIGKDVIPELLKRGVKVFIIGRHGPGQKYRPDIPDLSKIRLLPKEPLKMLVYPPDPASNDFVKYRVQRLVDPASDPRLRSEEKTILDNLAKAGITGLAVLKAIFQDVNNRDKSDDPEVHQWYTHSFSLNGGEEMKLDPSGLYDKPVSYRTFFQVAVQEIG